MMNKRRKQYEKVLDKLHEIYAIRVYDKTKARKMEFVSTHDVFDRIAKNRFDNS
jgi:hypothetical protein